MNLIICTLVVLSAALQVQSSTLTLENQWEAFKAQHGRKFANIDARRTRFIAAKAAVDKHNAEAAEGKHTYTQAVYAHSIMTEEEKAMMKGRSPVSNRNVVAQENMHVSHSRAVVPASLDLRTCGCLPAVHDQGGCGSCWTFAATQPMEFQNCCLKGLKTPVLLSEQVFVDCTCGGNGCNGGLEYNGWDHLIKNNMGIQTLADYPYVAANQPCVYNASKPLVKLSGYKRITSFAVTATGVADMKQALTTYGVIAVAVQANGAWSSYSSGIFSSTTCGTSLDHSVVCVGWGTDPVSGKQFWIVRNSWGSGWGEGGYIRMLMGINQCGVEMDTSYPIVAV